MVFLKFNWGKAQTEPVEMDNAFEIQRIYVKKRTSWQGLWQGNVYLCLKKRLKNVDLTGSGWVSGNAILRRKTFYYRFGFERFSEHQYITGEPWIQTGCCASKFLEGENRKVNCGSKLKGKTNEKSQRWLDFSLTP